MPSEWLVHIGSLVIRSDESAVSIHMRHVWMRKLCEHHENLVSGVISVTDCNTITARPLLEGDGVLTLWLCWGGLNFLVRYTNDFLSSISCDP